MSLFELIDIAFSLKYKPNSSKYCPVEFILSYAHSFTAYISHHKNKDTTDSQFIGSKHLSDLNISKGFLGFSPFILLTASKSIIQDTKCKGSYLPIDKKIVKISSGINLQYSVIL